jgi:hypothetical protein
MNDQDKQLMEELRQIMQDLLEENKHAIHKMIEDTVTKKLPEVERTNQPLIEQVVSEILSKKLSDKLVKNEQSLSRITNDIQELQKQQRNTPPLKSLQDEYSKLQREIKQIRQEIDELKSSSQGDVRHVSEAKQTNLKAPDVNAAELHTESTSVLIPAQQTQDTQSESVNPTSTESLHINDEPQYQGIYGKIQSSEKYAKIENAHKSNLLMNFQDSYPTSSDPDTVQNHHIWLFFLLELLHKNKKPKDVKFKNIEQLNSTLTSCELCTVNHSDLKKFQEWMRDRKQTNDTKLRNTSINGSVLGINNGLEIYTTYFQHISEIISDLISPPSRASRGRNNNRANQ